MRKIVFSCLASVVTLIAFVSIQPTSLVSLYQPEVPKALKK